jgi:hypothetical protein
MGKAALNRGSRLLGGWESSVEGYWKKLVNVEVMGLSAAAGQLATLLTNSSQ